MVVVSGVRDNNTCFELVNFFDLEQIRWQSTWEANQDYAIPVPISAVIGGR
jgi:hypothetical protein